MPSPNILGCGFAVLFQHPASAQDRTFPELVPQTGHAGPVRNLVFTNNAMLASTGDDGTIKVWDVRSHALVRTLHRDATGSPASGGTEPFSIYADGSRLLVGRELGYADEVDVATGRIVNAYDASMSGKPKSVGPPVTAVLLSPDGEWAITGNGDGTVVAFNRKQATAQIVRGERSLVTNFWFSSYSSQFVVRYEDGKFLSVVPLPD